MSEYDYQEDGCKERDKFLAHLEANNKFDTTNEQPYIGPQEVEYRLATFQDTYFNGGETNKKLKEPFFKVCFFN